MPLGNARVGDWRCSYSALLYSDSVKNTRTTAPLCSQTYQDCLWALVCNLQFKKHCVRNYLHHSSIFVMKEIKDQMLTVHDVSSICELLESFEDRNISSYQKNTVGQWLTRTFFKAYASFIVSHISRFLDSWLGPHFPQSQMSKFGFFCHFLGNATQPSLSNSLES